MKSLLLVLLMCSVALAQPTATFTADVSLVKVDVQVVQGRKFVAGLTQDDFQVLDQGEPRQIVYFGQESEPLWVLLLLDVSGSMRKHVKAMATASNKAMSALNPGDKVGVMVFSRETHLLQPFTDDHGLVVGQLNAAVRHRGLSAGTSINNAMIEAANYMRTELGNKPGRRSILILTDNKGMNYQLPDATVLEALLKADTVLNAIVVGSAKPPKPTPPELVSNVDFSPSDVFRMAQETGGDVVRASNAGQAFARLLEAIRTRYSLHFRAPEGESGEFRELKVELAGDAAREYKRATIRARRGYYLP